jgi:TonB family protein
MSGGVVRIKGALIKGILSAALLLSPAASARAQGGAAAAAAGPRLVTVDKQLTVLMPGKPSVHESARMSYRLGGEKFTSRRVLYAYGAGVVCVVRVYEGEHIVRLLSDVLGNEKDGGERAERPVTRDGVEGLERTSEGETHYSRVQYFATKERLYVIYAAARDKGNPFLGRVFASVRITGGDAAPKSDAARTIEEKPFEVGYTPSAAPAEAGAAAASAKEVTRKAVLVWKAQPGFTEEARNNNVTGVVRLRLVLRDSGTVSNIVVVKGLPDGLTERAIAAALHVSFLPAEKDSRPVSQWVTIEYNFNIY